MKKYIGTKTVHAEPMKYGEAYKEGLIRENAYVSEYDDNDGYMVEYEDGYKSWSPAEVFESAYKIAETPVDRINIEQNEVGERWVKLTEFQHSEAHSQLDTASKAMLAAQRTAMQEYLRILHARHTKMESGNGGLNGMRFGTAITLLECGYSVRREEWNGKNLMVFKTSPGLNQKRHHSEDAVASRRGKASHTREHRPYRLHFAVPHLQP